MMVLAAVTKSSSLTTLATATRMPVASSRRLHAAAGEPKTIRWIDAGHVDIRSREFHGKVRDELVAWLVTSGLIVE